MLSCGGFPLRVAAPINDVGFVLFLLILLLIHGQQWFNKIISIVRPERAHHSRAQADDRSVLRLGIDMAFVETVPKFHFLLGIQFGLVHPWLSKEGDSEQWSDKSGMGGEIK